MDNPTRAPHLMTDDQLEAHVEAIVAYRGDEVDPLIRTLWERWRAVRVRQPNLERADLLRKQAL